MYLIQLTVKAWVFAGLVFAFPLFVSAVEMGTASGSLTVDGNKVDLKWAYAIKALDTFDKSKKITVLILTDKAIEQDPFPGKNQLMFMGVQQKFKGITAEIDDTGKLTGLTTIVEQHSQMSGTLPLNADSITVTDDLVQGKFEASNERFVFDVAFKTQFKQLPSCSKMFVVDKDTWEKLPADGGEPGKAFTVFDTGFNTKNLEMVKSTVCPEHTKRLSPLMFEGPSMRATDIKITGGYIRSDKALIYAEGDSIIPGNPKDKLEIYMSKTASGWKVVKQTSQVSN